MLHGSFNHDTEIVVRIVDEQESAELNEQYRTPDPLIFSASQLKCLKH